MFQSRDFRSIAFQMNFHWVNEVRFEIFRLEMKFRWTIATKNSQYFSLNFKKWHEFSWNRSKSVFIISDSIANAPHNMYKEVNRWTDSNELGFNFTFRPNNGHICDEFKFQFSGVLKMCRPVSNHAISLLKAWMPENW